MVLEHLQRQDSIITFPGTYVKSPLEIKKRGSMHCTMNLSLPEHTGLRVPLWKLEIWLCAGK